MDIGLNLDTELVSAANPKEPLCVEPDTPIHQVLDLLKEHGRGSLLVCEEGRLTGIFTERDALRVLAAGGDLDAPVRQVMSKGPVTVRMDDKLSTVVSRMATNGYRRLPIVDSGQRPVGVIGAATIVHWLVEHFPKAVYNLPPTSKPTTHEREGS